MTMKFRVQGEIAREVTFFTLAITICQHTCRYGPSLPGMPYVTIIFQPRSLPTLVGLTDKDPKCDHNGAVLSCFRPGF